MWTRGLASKSPLSSIQCNLPSLCLWGHVEGRKGSLEEREGAIQSCCINRPGGGALSLQREIGQAFLQLWIPAPGDRKKDSKVQSPCGHGEVGEVETSLWVRRWLLECILFLSPPSPLSLLMLGFSRLLYQSPISGLRRVSGGGPGECPAGGGKPSSAAAWKGQGSISWAGVAQERLGGSLGSVLC